MWEDIVSNSLRVNHTTQQTCYFQNTFKEKISLSLFTFLKHDSVKNPIQFMKTIEKN